MTSSRSVVALLMAQAALFHFGRVAMSVAGAEKIIPDAGVSPTTMGWVYSAYLWAYTLFMIPGGVAIDRWGARRALVVVGVGSAACAVLTGIAGVVAGGVSLVWALVVARAAGGIAGTPFHPGAARGVSLWIAAPSRPAANGLVTAASIVGVASTYTLFGAAMDAVGWPTAFLVTAAAIAGVTALWSRTRQPPVGVTLAGAPRAVWKDRSVLLLTLSYAAVGYVQYLFFYWMQYYFEKVLLLGKGQARLYSTIAALTMAAGMAVGGAAFGALERRLGRRRGRAVMTAVGMATAAALLVAGAHGASAAGVIGCFVVAMFAIGAVESAFWTTATDLGGARGGTCAAIVNTGGNAGGAIAPMLTPFVAERLGWQSGLSLAAGIALAGGLLWIWIDPGGATARHLARRRSTPRAIASAASNASAP